MNTQITFNENTYRFDYYEGRDGNNNIYECYGIYKNGELNSDFFLEEGTIVHGVGENQKVDKIFTLYFKTFCTSVSIKDFSILEVARVIDYIIKTYNK